MPQVMARQRTAADVIGLGTGPADLVVAAAMEMPVALELGATGALAKLLVDVRPWRPPMLLHVIVGDLIRDALIAESGHQPIEHGRGVAIPDCCLEHLSARRSARMSSIRSLTRRGRRHGMDQPNSVVDCRSSCEFWDVFGACGAEMLRAWLPFCDHGLQIIATSLR